MAKQQTKSPGALRIMWRTRPFLTGRVAVYSVFFFATIGFLVTLSFVFFKVVQSALIQALFLVVAIAGYWLVQRSLKKHLGHVGYHPHIAAMIGTIKGRKLPKRRAQIEDSIARVSARFPESNQQFQLEGLVGKIIKDSSTTVIEPAKMNPFPGFNRLKYLNKWILSGALQVMRTVIFGYTLFKADVDVWRAARRGVNLWAQVGTNYVKSLVRIYMLGVVFGLICIGILLIPGLDLLSAAEGQGIVTLIILFIGIIKSAWVVKRAFYEPYAMARALTTFVKHTEGLGVDPEWDSRLAKASRRFSDLADRSGKPVAVVKPAEEPSEDADTAVRSEIETAPAESEDRGEGGLPEPGVVLAPTLKMSAVDDEPEPTQEEMDKFADELAELDDLFDTQIEGSEGAQREDGEAPSGDESNRAGS